MLFRRRNTPRFMEKVRIAVWPRHSWRRSARYFVKRVLRISGTPHAIAAGVAAGVFSAFTPFMGFHFVISFAVAFAIRGNMLAAALGTMIGNPLTFPFIWTATYGLGSAMLGHDAVAVDAPHGFGEVSFAAIWPLIAPMTVGAIPLGAIAGAVSYVIALYAVRAFREVRRERLALRRQAQRAVREADGT